MTCECHIPTGIAAEIPRLQALGGNLLGVCGDSDHTYGFHLPLCRLPLNDYSLRYGRGPSDMAAAIDIGMNWSDSRKWLAWLINEVRSGRREGIVEIIGSLDGRTAYYWARWQGWRMDRYTGSGHVGWAHVSYSRIRSHVDQHLLDWKASTPVPPLQPNWTEKLVGTLPELRRGSSGTAVMRAQALLNVSGAGLVEDGTFGPLTQAATQRFQGFAGTWTDGVIGPITWSKLLGV